MRRLTAFTLALASAIATPAPAAVTLIAIGSLNGGTDLSGLSYKLENGLAQNILGGMGSGLAYAGGTTFLATPDRGPNALAYNSAIDDTTSYISRFQTLNLNLVAATGGALPFTLTPTLTATTLLYSPTALSYGTGTGLGNDITGAALQAGSWVNTGSKNYFTGRSDNYGAGNSGNPLNGRFDPEAIRVSNDGLTVFVSDEYGPYVRQFDRTTGALIRTYNLPANLNVANLSPQGGVEISGNISGRTSNKGMEGLAITPDGKTLVGIMQAPLIGDPAKFLRIVTIDIASGATKEVGVKLTDGSGVSEIVAIDATHFLIDERDGKGLGDGSAAAIKKLYAIDISGATDITNIPGSGLGTVTVATKSATPFLNLVSALTAYGIPATQIPSKIEGVAFGQDVVDASGKTLHTLFIANDNDFDPANAGTNQFYVFGFTDADLPGFTPQAGAVPEPSTWLSMIAGFGVIGAGLRRTRKSGLNAKA
jgi:Esterase-like activity of phytase/PEP-CTERM motif